MYAILSSPLEQFYVLPLVTTSYFTINNIIVIFFILISFITLYLLGILKSFLFDTYLIPNRWQLFLENIHLNVSSIIEDNIQSEHKNKFLPIVSSVFFLILNLNLFGIIPYTFTISSELIITFALSLSIFIGIQIIAVITHKLQFFSLFFPSGVSVVLSLLLVPIELISFFFKPISLSIRLFANMMAGHTLLKVIAGFTWSLMCINTVFVSTFITVPLGLSIITFLFILESGVAVIQAFVFAVLFCIYINDILNLH